MSRGVIHGQAEVGNILLRAGALVFIDLERVAIGPCEWDLIDTAVTVTRFGPEQRYRDFADAYGFDVRAWNGYQTYRRLWEFRALGLDRVVSLCVLVDHRPSEAGQVREGRLSSARGKTSRGTHDQPPPSGRCTRPGHRPLGASPVTAVTRALCVTTQTISAGRDRARLWSLSHRRLDSANSPGVAPGDQDFGKL